MADPYLDFAAYYEVDTFFDLHWMTNAFVIDYMADRLLENGCNNAYLASYDGFNRNLDSRGNSYSHNVYDRMENDIYLPAVYNYQEPTAIVTLRNYPMSDADRWHYYGYSDGTITTTFVDPVDGVSKNATDNLFAYSTEVGCAEILLQTAPVFIADDFDLNALEALMQDDIFAIWGEGGILYYNDRNATLSAISDCEEQYSIMLK